MTGRYHLYAEMKKRIIGIVLVAIGLIGCLFPIAPGIPLVIAGAALILGFSLKKNKVYKKIVGEEGAGDGPAGEGLTE
ncbi:MAG: hypothetical protein GY771_07395 [bacterium]|nr:hypothetical protein [bacterium]